MEAITSSLALKLFDVVPSTDGWEFRDLNGKAIRSSLAIDAALQLAWVTAMNNRPATARLLTADGEVEMEWEYRA